jgi:hypothetical protein
VHPLPADPAKAAKVEARRAAVDADYVRRAAARAPPHDAACTMCGRPSDVAPDGGSIEASHRGAERAMGGALGPLILVRASAISVVWCHEQCAAWAPEVFLDDGGRFAAVEDACRRGRMIKCRACGGFFPWESWGRFLEAAAAPGNGGVLRTPTLPRQTSFVYRVPTIQEAKEAAAQLELEARERREQEGGE